MIFSAKKRGVALKKSFLVLVRFLENNNFDKYTSRCIYAGCKNAMYPIPIECVSYIFYKTSFQFLIKIG